MYFYSNSATTREGKKISFLAFWGENLTSLVTLGQSFSLLTSPEREQQTEVSVIKSHRYCPWSLRQTTDLRASISFALLLQYINCQLVSLYVLPGVWFVSMQMYRSD